MGLGPGKAKTVSLCLALGIMSASPSYCVFTDSTSLSLRGQLHGITMGNRRQLRQHHIGRGAIHIS